MEHKIYPSYPGGKSKALALSYDDGVVQDEKFLSILNEYGLKTALNLNSGMFTPEGTVFPEDAFHRRLTEAAARALYTDCGHEIAVHGLEHGNWTTLPLPLALRDIYEDRKNLEALFGTLVGGAAAPYGIAPEAVLQALPALGIHYCRLWGNTFSFELPGDWLHLIPTCHHAAPELMDVAKEFLQRPKKHSPHFFLLAGHSYEFDIDKNWQVLEKFCQTVGRQDDVWYATPLEICRYMEAYRRLEFFADGRTVWNPNACSVWVHVSKTGVTEIKPGEKRAI